MRLKVALFKRIFLFLALNFAVVLTLSFVTQLLHIGPILNSYGLNIPSLMLFCLVWGMGGAFISLLISKHIAKWSMGVKTFSKDVLDPELLKLYEIVERLSKKAGIKKMPQIGVYDSNEVNAFATGATKNNALVAVSKGLLKRMDSSEVEAVLGHELSHITNGDMVTMTLLQGVVNAFVLFLARILAFAISGLGRKGNNNSYGSFRLFTFLFEIVFMLLGSFVTAAFSRFREFRADLGGAKLAGKEPMIDALKTLRLLQEIKDPVTTQAAAFQSLKISSSSKKRGFLNLLSTHPPLEERIERLQKL